MCIFVQNPNAYLSGQGMRLFRSHHSIVEELGKILSSTLVCSSFHQTAVIFQEDYIS